METDRLTGVRAEVVLHKVVSHLPISECLSPLEDWTRQWNNAADFQADLANSFRPSFFNKVWTRYLKYRQDWKTRVHLMTQLHVGVASQDCKGESVDFEQEDQGFNVSLFDFVTTLNHAETSVHLSTWLELSGNFGSQLGPAADVLLTKLCQWFISVDASASDMRLVGLVELFVAFHLHEAGSPLRVSSGHSDRYSLVSFARDFSYFKKLLKQFADSTCQ